MRVSDLNIDRIYVNSIVRSANYKMVENHFHYYYELFYVRQGGCRFFINNSLYDLHAGDYLIIPPREVHFNRYLSQCTRINVYFRESDLLENGGLGSAQREQKFLRLAFVHIPHAYRGEIEAILDGMLREDKVDDDATALALSLELKQFFLLCSRYCTFSRQQTQSEGDRAILDAARYITENYAQPITLEDLSSRAGLSPSYFSRRFRQTTGMGMKEYLSFIRLQHASMELLSTRHTVTEVAFNCGFSDSNYFKDAFRRMYGLSPRAFRNSRTTDYILKQSILTQPQGWEDA
jgi:AraC-like DNA-binding protein